MKAGERLRPGPFLRGVHTIAAREFAATFESGVGSATLIAALLLANSIFMNEFFLAGRIDMQPFFARLPLLLVLLLVLLLQRRERRSPLHLVG